MIETTPSQGTTEYLNAVTNYLGGGYEATDQFMRLFMAPGMGHCSGGAGPNAFGYANGNTGTIGNTPPLTPDADHDIFRALVRWMEQGQAPQKIIATKYVNDNRANGVQRTRPLCVYPQVARYQGTGTTNDASNFACVLP
ncbi:MAG: tannase/feruloyl esterase family alpha/beta hydrolase [Burkholderiales bacterium]